MVEASIEIIIIIKIFHLLLNFLNVIPTLSQVKVGLFKKKKNPLPYIYLPLSECKIVLYNFRIDY